MNKQRVEIIDAHSGIKARFQREYRLISLIKERIKSSKKPAESQVHFPVTEINSGIDQTRFSGRITKYVS
jgi:hypothetical protein